MKRLFCIVITFLCFASCQKAPQDLLVGTWEISSKSTYTTGNAATTVDNSVFYCVFEKNGDAKFIYTASFELLDVDELYFTYVYDNERNAIVFSTLSGRGNFSWIVDELTAVSLTCHSTSEESSTTYSGRKMQ
ncbi:MAG: hypothetical protein IKX28_00885 [Bacteroidales bacterium]|nr:hypothetical protein [Bacteroidales bacterium]